jgi:transcriptional regulator with XRE-family HTH domain
MLDRNFLRQARERAHLSQQALGTHIGQDQQYISKLERGVLESMTIGTLVRLADVLRCTTDELLGRTIHQGARPDGGEGAERVDVDRVPSATATRS